MTTLKKCPFCGGTASLNEKELCWVECDGDECSIYSIACPEKDDAISSWNTRPLEDTLRQRVAELEAQLEEEISLKKYYKSFLSPSDLDARPQATE